MKTFEDAEVRLAESLPGYESRPQQQALAQAVEAVFANPDNFGAPNVPLTPRHLIAQAGCGTGKSLAYLIPTILSGKRSIVSVTTKALQDQLAGKDMPFLEQNLGLTFSWTVLKGRGNYLCLNKAETADEADVPMLADLLRIADARKDDPNFDGSRESLGIEMTHGQWAKVNSESEECKANECGGKGHQVGVCFATDAREHAKDCTIVIVNHALFFTDLSVKARFGSEGMLGEYDLVVFDEAHEVEEIAGNTLGAQFSEGSFASVCAEIRNYGHRHADDDAEIGPAIANLMAAAQGLFGAIVPGRLRAKEMDDNAQHFGAVFDGIDRLGIALMATKLEHASDYAKAKRVKDRLRRRMLSLRERFVESITADFDVLVRWCEEETTGKGEKRKVLKVAPIDVSPFLRKFLFTGDYTVPSDPAPAVPCILVSATLAVKGSMEYIAGRLGIDTYDELDVGTPFDFPSQARLYVPVHLPEPRGTQTEAWEAQATQEIVDLLRASDGRALVLFTSVKHMKAAFASVQMQLGSRFSMKMQGQQGETTKGLAQWFDTDNHGVLFGTKSFFTGVDFQGETCSLVIVAKMPFPVPTEPMTEARCDAIRAKGGNDFSDYTIPVMSLTLQQAVGRLIRHREDTGVVAILDPRLVTKGYGKQIMRDLPPMGYTASITEVEEFFGPSKREAGPALVSF